MNRIAEKLSEWFGSTPFILFNVLWISAWVVLRLPVEVFTLVLSIEAIFLALFILRAENVQNGRIEELLKTVKRLTERTEEISKEDLRLSKQVIKLIKERQ